MVKLGKGIPIVIIKVTNTLKRCFITSTITKSMYGKTKAEVKNKDVHLFILTGRSLKAIILAKTVQMIKKKKSANLVHNSA